MPQPALGDRHVNSLLTNLSLLSVQEAKSFVAPHVCPVIRVAKQSDYYAVYTDAFFRRNVMKKRAPGAESAGGGFEIDNTNSYHCDKYALHVDVPDDHRRNADSVFDIDAETTMFLTQQMMQNMEQAFASEIFATSTWTGSTTGGDITPSTKWDAAAGTPISDVRLQMASVKKKTGQEPNVLVLGRLAWESIRDNADVIDRIKGYQFGVPNEATFAAACGLDKVLVADAIKTSSVEGASSETTAYIHDEDGALLLHVPSMPGRMTPMAATSFIWTGDQGMGLNEYGAAIKKFRLDRQESDRIEVNQYFDLKVTSPNLGARFIAVDS